MDRYAKIAVGLVITILVVVFILAWPLGLILTGMTAYVALYLYAIKKYEFMHEFDRALLIGGRSGTYLMPYVLVVAFAVGWILPVEENLTRSAYNLILLGSLVFLLLAAYIPAAITARKNLLRKQNLPLDTKQKFYNALKIVCRILSALIILGFLKYFHLR